MTLPDMHIVFRQYAQQMGMQNVRAITPEQIDVLINTSITDTVNQLIAENIGGVNDRGTIDNSKLGKINAFSTLHADFEISIKDIINSSATPNIWSDPIEVDFTKTIGRILFLVNLSVNYKDSDNNETKRFPVHLIDNAYLANNLNDFILAPKFKSPIAVISNQGVVGVIEENVISDATVSKDDNKLSLYFGTTANKLGIIPNVLYISAITTPAKVSTANNIDCNLPAYLHEDIIKRAVDLYRISVNNGLYGAQRPQNSANASNRPATENY